MNIKELEKKTIEYFKFHNEYIRDIARGLNIKKYILPSTTARNLIKQVIIKEVLKECIESLSDYKMQDDPEIYIKQLAKDKYNINL